MYFLSSGVKGLKKKLSEISGKVLILTLSLPRVINFQFPLQLTRNITSHSMENLAFHSLLKRMMIILPILALFELGSERVNDTPGQLDLEKPDPWIYFHCSLSPITQLEQVGAVCGLLPDMNPSEVELQAVCLLMNGIGKTQEEGEPGTTIICRTHTTQYFVLGNVQNNIGSVCWNVSGEIGPSSPSRKLQSALSSKQLFQSLYLVI